MLHTLLTHLLSFLFPYSEGYLISFLSSTLVVYSRFFIFLPLFFGTLYPRSNQDVSAGVLGYLLTVVLEEKGGGAEPDLSIFCLSLQLHRDLFVSCSCLTPSDVLL